MRNFTKICLSLLVMLVMGAGSTFADHLSNNLLFSARLSGANLVPPVAGNANGIASFMLNNTRDSVCVNIATTGLSGPIVGLHIHEGAAGTNGGVIINLTGDVVNNRVSTTIPVSGMDIEKMMQDLYYVNVHTSNNPDGEIRGQIKLETDYSYVSWLDEAFVSSGATGYGLAIFNLSLDSRWIEVKVMTTGLTGPITAAHLHSVATTNVVVGLDSLIAGQTLRGMLDATTFMPSMLAGDLYLNIHTTLNPNGEIAGVTNIDKSDLAFDVDMDNTFHGTPSTGTGLAHVSLNATMDTVNYWIIWDNLQGTPDAMHFHHSSGGVMYNITPDIMGNEARGSWAMPADSVITDFLTGGSYINLHTNLFANGEISGNVIRLAREGYQINMNGSSADPMTPSNAQGGGMVSINRGQTNAHYMMALDGLDGTFSAAHFHLGVMGSSGGVLYTLPFANGGAYGYWSDSSMVQFQTANSVQFRNDSVYVNVHTSAFPNGEIRGQVLRRADCFQIILSADDAIENTTGMTVYPNPATDFIRVAVEGDVRVDRVEIMDATGRIMQTVNNTDEAINISNLPNGLYFVKVSQEGSQLATKRIVIMGK